jgi:hypothetical protein
MPSIMVRNRVNLGHRRSQRGRQRDSYRLEVIDQRTRQIEELSVRIEVVMEPFQSFCTLIHTITGIGQRCAEVVVAGTGADMNVFPTAAHLASWAGTCPGGNESAGRVKSTATRPGNAYLKAALGAAALSIANTQGSCLSAKYKRIAAARGPKKGLVAVEHANLTTVWTMAHTGALCDDPGADYYTAAIRTPQASRDDPARPPRLGLKRVPATRGNLRVNPRPRSIRPPSDRLSQGSSDGVDLYFSEWLG